MQGDEDMCRSLSSGVVTVDRDGTELLEAFGLSTEVEVPSIAREDARLSSQRRASFNNYGEE